MSGCRGRSRLSGRGDSELIENKVGVINLKVKGNVCLCSECDVYICILTIKVCNTPKNEFQLLEFATLIHGKLEGGRGGKNEPCIPSIPSPWICPWDVYHNLGCNSSQCFLFVFVS